jgi:hypothetical protein
VKLLRALRFDDSDTRVYERAAEDGEWAVPGGFEFADDTVETLVGKRRQAFANGFLGLAGFGRATFVAVATADDAVRRRLIEVLAGHFVDRYGAPDRAAALPVAEQEIAFAAELCAEYEPGTTLTVVRELGPDGVRESFRRVAAAEPGAVQSLWSMFDEDGKFR